MFDLNGLSSVTMSQEECIKCIMSQFHKVVNTRLQGSTEDDEFGCPKLSSVFGIVSMPEVVQEDGLPWNINLGATSTRKLILEKNHVQQTRCFEDSYLFQQSLFMFKKRNSRIWEE